MKLQNKDIQHFLAKPSEDIRIVLVYGPDYGLVCERIKILESYWLKDSVGDPFLHYSWHSSQLKDASVEFRDVLSGMSLVPGQRVVTISWSGVALSSHIQEIFNMETDAKLLIRAEDLGPSSALRKYIEKTTHAMAVPCYQMMERDIIRVVRDTMHQQNMTIDDAALRYIAHLSHEDTLLFHKELEKLLLYKAQDSQITLEDVKVIWCQQNEAYLDDLVFAFAEGHQGKLYQLMQDSIQQGVSIIAIFRMMQRYIIRLYEVQSYIQDGATVQDAMNKLQPKVFFKLVPMFKQHLSLWSKRRCIKVLERLMMLESLAKTSSGLPSVWLQELYFLMPRRQKAIL